MGNEPGGFQFGDVCGTCIGVIFEFGRTPAYLAVQFTGIEKLIPTMPDPPNGHRFILIETAFCYWFVHGKFNNLHYQVWVDLDAPVGDTWIKGKWLDWPDMYFFEHINPAPCIIEGDSQLPDLGDPTRNGYGSGHGDVSWGSAINESAYREQDLAFPPP